MNIMPLIDIEHSTTKGDSILKSNRKLSHLWDVHYILKKMTHVKWDSVAESPKGDYLTTFKNTKEVSDKKMTYLLQTE